MSFNWIRHQSATEATHHLFNNEFISDITFVCDVNDNKLIYAHSFELIKRSPKFFASFKNSIGVCKVIPVANFTYDIFLEFIRFVYTDNCELNNDNVLDMLRVSKEYSVSMLEQRCINIIIDQMSVDTVCKYLELSIREGYEYIQYAALKFIEKNFSQVLQSDSFYEIEKDTLRCILNLNQHDGTPEIDIFQAVMKWAEMECRQDNISLVGESKRMVLGDLIKQIRFPIMPADDFGRCTTETVGLLTDQEISSIFQSITVKKKNEFGFVDEERRGPGNRESNHISMNRKSVKFNGVEDLLNYEVVYLGAGKIEYLDLNSHCFYTEFTVSNPISFVGLTVLGSNQKNFQLFVKIKDVKTDRCLRQSKVTAFENRLGVLKADVKFDSPLQLKPDTEYSILYFYAAVCREHFGYRNIRTVPWLVQLPTKNVQFCFKSINQNLEKLWVC